MVKRVNYWQVRAGLFELTWANKEGFRAESTQSQTAPTGNRTANQTRKCVAQPPRASFGQTTRTRNRYSPSELDRQLVTTTDAPGFLLPLCQNHIRPFKRAKNIFAEILGAQRF